MSLDSSVERLRKMFIEGGYDVLVVDTLSKLGGITNESDPAQVSRALLAAQKVREGKPGASSLVIHHTDARATKARGASPIRDNVDTLWMMRQEGDGFSLSTRVQDGGKMKDAPEERIQGFRLEPFGEAAVVRYTGKVQASKFWDPVRTLLEDGQWHTGTELRAACGITGSTGADYEALKKELRFWVDSGLLVKDPAAPEKRPRYRIDPLPGGH